MGNEEQEPKSTSQEPKTAGKEPIQEKNIEQPMAIPKPETRKVEEKDQKVDKVSKAAIQENKPNDIVKPNEDTKEPLEAVIEEKPQYVKIEQASATPKPKIQEDKRELASTESKEDINRVSKTQDDAVT